MSLLRPAIRACAVAALKDRTWCEDRVYDSDMTALSDAVMGGPPKPYVCVYTDTDDRPRVTGAELYEGENRLLNLVLEIGVANAIEGKSGDVVLQFAATDRGMELAVDMVETQCIAALFGDPQSQWGEILKRLCYRVLRVPSRRGGQARGGIRFAARRLTFVVNTLYDIPPGTTLPDGHPLMDFIVAARGNPSFGITDVGQILYDMMSNTNAPDWKVAQALLGMTQDSAAAVMVPGVPLPYPEIEKEPLDWSTFADRPPPVTDIELDDTLSDNLTDEV